MSREVSLHPPHLLDSAGSLTPAALIPFCAYQTNMTLLGQDRPDLPFPVCNAFKPALLEGQVCHSLNIRSAKMKTRNGRENGLVLILDPGIQEDDQDKQTDNVLEGRVMSLNFEQRSVEGSFSRIYLNTLSSFTDFRDGSFAMTSLKKVTGTESFLKQTDNQKKCRVETIEDCLAREYSNKIKESCGCLPWALSQAVKTQVSCQRS